MKKDFQDIGRTRTTWIKGKKKNTSVFANTNSS